jgi:S-adenosylmethionine:tRNA ribosyltransferase-isomerase
VIPAAAPAHRTLDAKLLAIDADGLLHHETRRAFVGYLRTGDLVVANDAATLPASLHGWHEPTGLPIEVRLAAWRSGAVDDVARFAAVIFGAGDYHTRTESRPLPPPLAPGDRMTLGPLTGSIVESLGHPRLVSLRFDGAAEDIWRGIASHGRAIQYAHVGTPLALWDVWTKIAARPVAFEPPSAGFALDWHALAELRAHGVGFATITHAAGISSTGDADLDARLPLDEPYDIPEASARAIAASRARGGRIIAVGTSVVRALEHAAGGAGSVRSGHGVADQRITADSRLRVVDAILTGTHEPGTSHHELLRAFVDNDIMRQADAELNARLYRTHEFGDSMLIFQTRGQTSQPSVFRRL